MEQIIGHKITKLRKANQQERDTIGIPENEPLMTYELDNGNAIHCTSDRANEDGQDITLATIKNENGEQEIVEVDEK